MELDGRMQGHWPVQERKGRMQKGGKADQDSLARKFAMKLEKENKGEGASSMVEACRGEERTRREMRGARGHVNECHLPCEADMLQSVTGQLPWRRSSLSYRSVPLSTWR